jgi:cobalt/nickel transport system permease protein
MAGVHMLIGVGEAVITTLVIAAILRTRPDLVDPARSDIRPSASRLFLALALAATLGLLLFAVPFASSWPDGLERVAHVLGFAGRAAPPLAAPMPDYRLPGSWPALATTSVAGFIGTLVAFGVAYALAAALAPRTSAETDR